MKNDIFGHYLSYGIPMSLHGPIKGVDLLPDGKHIFMMEEMPFTVAVDVIKNQVSLQDEHWAFFREADNSLSYVHFWTKISGDCRRAQLRKEP